MTPEITFALLLVVQTLHLLHHRLAKRHISFAEVMSSGILCIPLDVLPGWVLMGAHLGVAAVQGIGSVWIRRLSPAWPAS